MTTTADDSPPTSSPADEGEPAALPDGGSNGGSSGGSILLLGLGLLGVAGLAMLGAQKKGFASGTVISTGAVASAPVAVIGTDGRKYGVPTVAAYRACFGSASPVVVSQAEWDAIPSGGDYPGCSTTSPPPSPPPADGRPVVTSITGLTVRAGPGTGTARIGSIAYGTPVTIACQTLGEMVQRSAVWDKLSAPMAGYVSDWWVSTPVTGAFSPGYAVCAGPGGSPPPPSPPPSPSPAPINSVSQLAAGMIISTGCGWNDADYLLVPDTWVGRGLCRWWIGDLGTWRQLNVPRAVIRRVTSSLLVSIRDGGDLYWSCVGPFCLWTVVQKPTIWMNNLPPHDPPRVITSPAGYCA